jgi:hypothetical protein
MSMFKKAARILAVAALPAALLVVTEAAPAGALGPNATGIANCPIYGGHGTLSPGLTPAGSPGGVKITFTATLTSPAGGPCGNANVVTPAGVRIVGGTVTGNGFYNPPGAAHGSSCANFHGPDTVGKITVVIHWLTTGGPIANTVIVYMNNPGTVTGAPFDTITLNAPPGTAAKSGSFTGPANLHKTQLVTNNLPAPPCGPGPFANFHISGGSVLV